MTFLNALLLGGTVAGFIPLAVHLLHRRKRKTLPWGAMQFLIAKSSAQRRKVKLEQLLLLVLRISIPVLLAICMARPVVENLQSNENNTPESVVLLIDNSASMNPSDAEASPFFAVKQAGEFFLAHLPRGSEVSMLPLCNPELSTIEFSVDIQGVSRLLKKLSIKPASAQIAEGLESSADLFSRAHHARRRIILMTDFQKTNWSKDRLASCEQVLARLNAQKPAPSITFYDAGASKHENVAVESIEYSKLPIGPGQKLQFTATVRNYGAHSASGKILEWKFDGETVSSKSVSLKPEESSQLSIERSFAEPGIHSVEARIEHDKHPLDDAFFACFKVYNPINVLIVNGHPSPEAMQGETDFLALALQPKIKTREKNDEGILRTSLVELNALNAKTLAKSKVAILADTRNLTKQQVQEIEFFVREGGGLLFFPGQQTDVEWTNKVLHAGGLGILPARIEGLQNVLSKAAQKSVGISKTVPNHPVTEFLTRNSGQLDEVAIENWYSLITSDARGHSEYSSPATVVLSLENGEPLFFERHYGRGTVIQSAIPCSPTWSNFPTRPAYVPMMQRLVLQSCISSQSPHNVIAGSPLIASFETLLSNQPILVTLPDGATTQCLAKREDSHTRVEFFETHQLGIYQLTTPDGELRKFAINMAKGESDPAKLESSEIQDIARRMQAGLAHTNEELLVSVHEENHGKEIWRPILWLILGLLIGEIFFLQRFANKGHART
jgi:hypothetical protein